MPRNLGVRGIRIKLNIVISSKNRKLRRLRNKLNKYFEKYNEISEELKESNIYIYGLRWFNIFVWNGLFLLYLLYNHICRF